MKRLFLTTGFLLAGLAMYAQMPDMRSTLQLIEEKTVNRDSFLTARGFTAAPALAIETGRRSGAAQTIWSFNPTGTGNVCRFSAIEGQPSIVLYTHSSYLLAGWMQELRELGLRWVGTFGEGGLLREEFAIGNYRVIYRSGGSVPQSEFQLQLEKLPNGRGAPGPLRRYSRRKTAP